MQPVQDAGELERAFGEPWALVFKHSTRCPVSSAAWRELAAFRKAHPEAVVYVVHVGEQRGPSNGDAAQTGVRHESPQAILLENGRVAWHDSHEGITSDALEGLLPASTVAG